MTRHQPRPRTTVLRGSIVKRGGIITSWNGFPVSPKKEKP